MRLRLGDLLVMTGALTGAQRDHILDLQASSGRPFGALAEELFGVSPRTVERAWASQYTDLTGLTDLDAQRFDPEVLPLVERRQAWQFGVLPVRHESGELLIATTETNLPRAMRFAGWALGGRVGFLVADADQLEAYLSRAYPVAGGVAAIPGVRQGL